MSPTARIASSKPSVSLEEAISTAEHTLVGQFNKHPATLEFLAKDDGSVVLTHVVQIQNDVTGAWVEAFVDAHANKVVSITDFVAKASVQLPFLMRCIFTALLTYDYSQIIQVSSTAFDEGSAYSGIRDAHQPSRHYRFPQWMAFRWNDVDNVGELVKQKIQ